MKPLFRTFIASVLIAATTTTQAALVAHGDYTTDTDTGLDWMDHQISVGMSFNAVLAELGPGGLFEGWQVATLDQAHDYLRNAGWIGPFDANNNQNVGFVTHLQTVTTDSFTDDPLGQLGMDRFLNDPASGLGILGLLDDPAGDFGDTSYSFDPIGDMGDSSVADPNTSTFLVRATVVPVPAAIWLFLSGLLALGVKARREGRA
jgi:hypothetical protein